MHNIVTTKQYFKSSAVLNNRTVKIKAIVSLLSVPARKMNKKTCFPFNVLLFRAKALWLLCEAIKQARTGGRICSEDF